jgi:hypothetical protein
MNFTVSTQLVKIHDCDKVQEIEEQKELSGDISSFEVRRGADISYLNRYISEGRVIVPSVLKGKNSILKNVEYTNMAILDFDGGMSYKEFKKQWYFKHVAITYSTIRDNYDKSDRFRAIILLPEVKFNTNIEYASVIKRLLKIDSVITGFDETCLQMSRKFYPGRQGTQRYDYINETPDVFSKKEVLACKDYVIGELKTKADIIKLEKNDKLKRIAETRQNLSTFGNDERVNANTSFPDEDYAKSLYIDNMVKKYLSNYVPGNRHINRYNFLLAMGYNDLKVEAIEVLTAIEDRQDIISNAFDVLDSLNKLNSYPAWMYYLQLPKSVCEIETPEFSLPSIYEKHDIKVVNKKYLSAKDITVDTRVSVISSVQGSGKTSTLFGYKEQSNKDIITLAHRKLLTRDIAQGLSIKNYTDMETNELNKHKGDISSTIQSLTKLNPKNYPEGSYDIVVDEYTQLLKDLNILIENNPFYLPVIKTFFTNASKIILLDSVYNEHALDVMLSLIDDRHSGAEEIDLLYGVQPVLRTDVTITHNSYQPNRHVTSHVKKESFMETVEKALNNFEKVVMPVGNKTGNQGIETILERLQDKVKGFDKKNYLVITGNYEYINNGISGQGEIECAELLKDVTNYDLLIYTSAMFTGVSVPVGSHNFDRVCGFYPTSSMFDSYDIIQSWNRCREIETIDFYTVSDNIDNAEKNKGVLTDSSVVMNQHFNKLNDIDSLLYRSAYYKWNSNRVYNLARTQYMIKSVCSANKWNYKISWLYADKESIMPQYTSRSNELQMQEKQEVLSYMKDIKETDGYSYARCVTKSGDIDANEYRLLSIKEKAEVMFEAFSYDGKSPYYLAKRFTLNTNRLESYKVKNEYAKLDFIAYKRKYKTELNTSERHKVSDKLVYSFIRDKHKKINNDIGKFKLTKPEVNFLAKVLDIKFKDVEHSIDWLRSLMRELLLDVPSKRSILATI